MRWSRASTDRNGVRILMKKAVIISCFGWYDRRLKPLKELLEREYDCIIITSDYIHSQKVYGKEKRSDSVYIHTPSYKKNVSLKRLLSHYLFSRRVYS